jgi:dinuclear metal center YbgI/SA1388 family protein
MSHTPTVNDLCEVLKQLAPLQLAESWDNVGLLLGRSGTLVRNVMTCLTLTEPVASEAIQRDVQLIVTHHPILFRGAKRLTDATSEGRMLLELIAAGIAVYSAHTAFDSAAEGINHGLAESLGLHSIRPLRPADSDPAVGAARFGELRHPIARDAFLSQVATLVSAASLEYSWNGPNAATRVAVACGSAAEFLADAAQAGCDTFVTGEARFHAVLEAQALGINLVMTGHYCSERPAVVTLATTIQTAFPGLRAFVSDTDRNPLELFRR